MPLVYADRVQETTLTTGTGALTLLGAVSGFQSFSVIGVGNTTYYTITDATTNAWEVGVGTVGISSLTRDTVLASSNANALVSFGTGSKAVFVVSPATFYTAALSTTGHAAINHTGLPGVPAPETFTAPVHATTDHTGITGVPAPEAFTSAVHATTNHAGITGVGDLTTAAHALIDHSAITGVLSPAAHLLVDHSGVPGVIPLKNQTLSTNITNVALTLYTVPAGTLSADGDSLDIELWFDNVVNGAGDNYSPLALGGTTLITAETAPGVTADRDLFKIRVTRSGASAGSFVLVKNDLTTSTAAATPRVIWGVFSFSWASSQNLTVAAGTGSRYKISYIRVEKRKAA